MSLTGLAMKKYFHNKHEGERCFVCGTGPSLNKLNLDLLDDEVFFGVNSFYKSGKIPQYYGISDMHVWLKHRHIYKHLDTQFFITGRAYQLYARAPLRMVRKPLAIPPVPRWTGGFARNVGNGLYMGDTVIFDVCFQVAYYMGFEEVYLIGVDWDYSGIHHFDGSPVDNVSGGAANEWGVCKHVFRIARDEYEMDGRKIYNATPGSRCDIFEFVKYEDLF